MSEERNGEYHRRSDAHKQPTRKKNKKQIKRQRKLDARLHKKMDKRHKQKLAEREEEHRRRKKSKKYRQNTAPKGRKKGTELSPELMARREKKRKKTKKTLILIATLLFVMIVGGSSYYFAQQILVSTIEVRGESRYTQEEIIAQSGIKIGDRLAYTTFFKSKEVLLAQFPYISKVSIRIGFSNKVLIKIEAEVIDYCIYTQNQFFAVSTTEKILGIKDGYTAGFPVPTVIANVNIPEIGKKIDYVLKDDNKIRLDIFEQLKYNEMVENTQIINMQNTIEIELYYGNSYKIIVGSIIDLSTKMKMLKEAITQYLNGQMGIIDIRLAETASFKPSKNVAFDFYTVVSE